MKPISTANAYLFVRIRDAFELVRNDGWQDWKAFVVSNGLKTYAALLVVNVVELSLGFRILPAGAIPYVVFGLLLGLVDFVALLARNQWKQADERFRLKSQRARTVSAVLLALVIVGVLVAISLVAPQAGKLPSP